MLVITYVFTYCERRVELQRQENNDKNSRLKKMYLSLLPVSSLQYQTNEELNTREKPWDQGKLPSLSGDSGQLDSLIPCLFFLCGNLIYPLSVS